VLPPKDGAHTAEVRIFTPRAEMPFAGHPNIGTAFVLARAGASYGRAVPQDRVVFEEKAGLVPITLLKDGGAISGARLASPQRLTIGDQVPVEAVASACGIATDDIKTRNHPPCIASCGVGFILAEVKSRTGLASAMPHIDVFRRDIVNRGTTGILIYTEVDDHDISIRARMFAPLKGIPEDPATGSANVALIGLLGEASARERPATVEDDRAGGGDGPPEFAGGTRRKTRRHRYGDLHRRTLRSGDARLDRVGVGTLRHCRA
jgi:trans-2,3-dihydro-3-hydroxyanthranilate isomerase